MLTLMIDRSIATEIAELIKTEGLDVGMHLRAQMLADRLRVSRSPVNEAETPARRRHRNRYCRSAARAWRALPRIARRSIGQQLLHRHDPARESRGPSAVVPLDELLERERNEVASEALRQHLLHTLDALSRISAILKP